MRKLTATLLTLAICLALLTPTLAAAPVTYSAAATNNPIVVSNSADVPDAHMVQPAVYKIQGYNYFKLRDVAMLLNGSARQFSVGYDDAAKSVSITTGKAYVPQGDELTGTASQSSSAIITNDSILIDGKRLTLTVYKIDGYNYFMLRDLGKALDFHVGYLEETKIVTISGARGYEYPLGDVDLSAVKTAWANYTDNDAVFRGCLNADLLSDQAIRHLPIFLFDAKAELDQFRTDFSDALTFDHGYDEVPSFDSLAEAYDDAFFTSHSLALVYVPASSCSFRFGVNGVWIDGARLCVTAEQLNHPETYDSAMAGWFLLIELDKSAVQNCTVFDAQLVSIAS